MAGPAPLVLGVVRASEVRSLATQGVQRRDMAPAVVGHPPVIRTVAALGFKAPAWWRSTKMPLPIGVVPGGVLPLSVGAAGVTILIPALPGNRIWVTSHVIRNPRSVYITLEDTSGAVLLAVGRVSAAGTADIEVPVGLGLQIRLTQASVPPVRGILHVVQG
jgi:hypothetical protein